MESATEQKTCCVRRALASISRIEDQTPPSHHGPARLPRLSDSRKALATPNRAVTEPFPASSAASVTYDATSTTVLYLAYGSNLSAETFRGARGIRPLSAINVSVPSLRLTFDLPGFAYREPCFANTAMRKIPKTPPKLPDPPKIPPKIPGGNPDAPDIRPPPYETHERLSKSEQQDRNRELRARARGDPVWDKGLIGVVYEVTREDYATIIKTEGGGSSYQDILVPCIPLAPNIGVPENPPEFPRPFLAHTLYAPQIRKPTDENNDDDGFAEPIEKVKKWWRKMLLTPMRSDPDYAQPSPRYLKLITDGAREHDLPAEYQEWLAKLQPYTVTSTRQKIGQFLFGMLFGPFLLFFRWSAKQFADEDGKAPVWLGLTLLTIFHLVWMLYDGVFKPLFGDGERTENTADDARDERMLDEKQGLLRLALWQKGAV